MTSCVFSVSLAKVAFRKRIAPSPSVPVAVIQMPARAGLTNRNLRLMIAAVIGVSVLGGGWYLIQIQNNRMDFSIPRASALLNYLG